MFAGTRYDPYAFNPWLELRTCWLGRKEKEEAAEVLTDFEDQAIAASKAYRLVGEQSFIRPFVVRKEPTPSFPMLIGTGNSLAWYGHGPWAYDLEPFQQLGISPGDVIFDCGAHAGMMSAFFGFLAGPTGRVLAFDPFPQNILQIRAQTRLNALENVEAIQAAVGEARKRIDVSNLSQQSRDQGNLGHGDQITIDVLPLDEYFDRKPTFIKLDVEAAEVDALRGARRILTGLRPTLFIEVHTHMLGQFGHTLTDLFEAIASDCYEIQYKSASAPWQTYAPGAENGIKEPMLVWAKERR